METTSTSCAAFRAIADVIPFLRRGVAGELGVYEQNTTLSRQERSEWLTQWQTRHTDNKSPLDEHARRFSGLTGHEFLQLQMDAEL